MHQPRQESQPDHNEGICARPTPPSTEPVGATLPSADGLSGAVLVVEPGRVKKSLWRHPLLWTALAILAGSACAEVWMTWARSLPDTEQEDRRASAPPPPSAAPVAEKPTGEA